MTSSSHRLAGVVLAFVMAGATVRAQTPPAPRSAVTLDVAAIRKQAALLADTRALLADPDPNVRLLAIRELAKSGDPIQRQLAIDAGLSSAETAMQEVALRAVIADTQQIVIVLAKADGTPITDGSVNVTYNVGKFDPNTGRIEGSNWNGQVQGAVFAFVGLCCGIPSGSLVWEAEAGEFRGTANLLNGTIAGLRKASWRPR